MKSFLCILLLGFSVPLLSAASDVAIHLSPAEAAKVGRKVWQNECAGKIEGLVSWNSGEAFPSLGIGHFIWYSKNNRGPFEESFPELVALYKQRGIRTATWMSGPAPWSKRSEMLGDEQRIGELRALLVRTVDIQTEFLVRRLNGALPKMLDAAPSSEQGRIRTRFQSVASRPDGIFALIDYVNFKGEGVLETERYQGQGWGLLQVLEEMRGSGDPVMDFSDAASRVLARRVKNAPPSRHEQRWLAGWQNRVRQYAVE